MTLHIFRHPLACGVCIACKWRLGWVNERTLTEKVTERVCKRAEMPEQGEVHKWKLGDGTSFSNHFLWSRRFFLRSTENQTWAAHKVKLSLAVKAEVNISLQLETFVLLFPIFYDSLMLQWRLFCACFFLIRLGRTFFISLMASESIPAPYVVAQTQVLGAEWIISAFIWWCYFCKIEKTFEIHKKSNIHSSMKRKWNVKRRAVGCGGIDRVRAQCGQRNSIIDRQFEFWNGATSSTLFTAAH